MFAKTQPLTSCARLAGLHVSVVHTSPSLQAALFGAPTQAPPEHVSVPVQAKPSLQGFALFVKRQPVVGFPLAGLHVSFVQAFRSLQFAFTGVLTQLPPEQASLVQLLPSEQVSALLAGFEHPPKVHTSSVQGLLSLHFEPSRT